NLDAPAALLLLARRVVPDVARAAEGFHALARSVQLRETVAAAEETEMISRKRAERSIVPAERLGPLLLALEVPANRAVKDGGAPGCQLGAAKEVALHLVLVAEHSEGATDFVEQLGRVPGLVLGGVVEGAVACDDRLMIPPIGERAHVGEYGEHIAHGDPPVSCSRRVSIARADPRARRRLRPPIGAWTSL